MPVLWFRDPLMSCSLNLASCRLRAESLARQLHLWSPSSGRASPCVVERQPGRMSSIDGEEEQQLVERSMPPEPTPPQQISPPYSPLERMGLLAKDPPDIYGECKDENHVWRPDSPPESFASSDSPALTLETGSTQSSAETVSELASPTYCPLGDEGSPLADELRSRLSLIQSRQDNPPTSPEESSTTSSLLSPPDCPRLVRSTSLKTGKTPPGTPSRKKIVRFADVLGLDLEAIRHFVKDDDAPIVPQSAFADLKIRPPAPTWTVSPQAQQARFVTQFEQPGSDPHFLDKVRLQKVCLENAVVSDLRVTGVVRVLNLGFEKLVQVRYTTTEWAVHTDLTADYVPKSCDGFSDKFSFTLSMPHLTPGQRLLFALRYVANGQEFWDNNSGENYVLKCQAKTNNQLEAAAATVNGPRWLHHFL